MENLQSGEDNTSPHHTYTPKDLISEMTQIISVLDHALDIANDNMQRCHEHEEMVNEWLIGHEEKIEKIDKRVGEYHLLYLDRIESIRKEIAYERDDIHRSFQQVFAKIDRLQESGMANSVFREGWKNTFTMFKPIFLAGLLFGAIFFTSSKIDLVALWNKLMSF